MAALHQPAWPATSAKGWTMWPVSEHALAP
jgi:hypothetical protein